MATVATLVPAEGRDDATAFASTSTILAGLATRAHLRRDGGRLPTASDTDGTRSALWAAVHRMSGPTACGDGADDCGDDDDEHGHNTPTVSARGALRDVIIISAAGR